MAWTSGEAHAPAGTRHFSMFGCYFFWVFRHNAGVNSIEGQDKNLPALLALIFYNKRVAHKSIQNSDVATGLDVLHLDEVVCPLQ
jgi:hypothetical protein